MSDRTERLLERLPEAEVDLMVVSDLTNVRYLTGYTGSNGLVLVGADRRDFLTDFPLRRAGRGRGRRRL